MGGKCAPPFLSTELTPQIETLTNAHCLPAKDVMKTMVDAIQDCFFVLNQQRQVVFANDAFLDAVDIEHSEQVLGKRPGDLLSCTHASEAPGGCGTTEACRHCGVQQAFLKSLSGIADERECHIMRTDGESLDFRVWAKPLQISNQQYSIFTIRNMAHEKRKNLLEGAFFHDLLNTASILSMYAQVLSVDPDQISSINKDLQTVTKRLIDEILAQKDLHAAENDEVTMQFDAVNPSELLHELGSYYKLHPLGRDKTIQIKVASDEMLQTDRIILGRVLGNMLKNALEASQAGDTITLLYAVKNGRVRFVVRNPGYIPRNIQQQIFQRSFSTKGSGRGQGTYSMKLLSEKYLQGTVRFVSSEEKGTAFIATYPLFLLQNDVHANM